jgi:hypothetical protein
MLDFFGEENEGGNFQFKDDPVDFDENDSARLASMHEGEILDDDGSVYNETDGFQEEEEGEPDINT